MTIKSIIEQKLEQTFSPAFLEVVNESYMHNVPEGSESHFKVTVVSVEFADKRLIARHRLINQTLADELNTIHALAIHTLTPDEYFAKAGKVADSPECLGGGK
ncbi:MAG: BolA family protein [Leucothrix sp.]